MSFAKERTRDRRKKSRVAGEQGGARTCTHECVLKFSSWDLSLCRCQKKKKKVGSMTVHFQMSSEIYIFKIA